MGSFLDWWTNEMSLPSGQNPANAFNHRESPKALEFFSELSNTYFKYVVSHPDDLSEIPSLNSKYGIASTTTILMPQAVNRNELDQKSGWIVELCK